MIGWEQNHLGIGFYQSILSTDTQPSWGVHTCRPESSTHRFQWASWTGLTELFASAAGCASPRPSASPSLLTCQWWGSAGPAGCWWPHLKTHQHCINMHKRGKAQITSKHIAATRPGDISTTWSSHPHFIFYINLLWFLWSLLRLNVKLICPAADWNLKNHLNVHCLSVSLCLLAYLTHSSFVCRKSVPLLHQDTEMTECRLNESFLQLYLIYIGSMETKLVIKGHNETMISTESPAAAAAAAVHCVDYAQVGLLPVKQSRSSARSGTGFFFSSCTHFFFIFLVKAGRRPCSDDASAPSSGPSFWSISENIHPYMIISCYKEHDRNWFNEHSALWDSDLQISALPRLGALQGPVNSMDGGVLCVGIHSVQGGATALLHQSRNTGTIQSLLKLLHKLEESPEKRIQTD